MKDEKTYRQKSRYVQSYSTELLYNEKISKLDIKVYVAIHYYLGVNEHFDMTYERLAYEVESTKGGVYKSVARLIDENFLRKHELVDGKGSVIELAQGCGQLKEKVSQRKQKDDEKFPSGNKNVSQRKQKTNHSLYTKQVLSKQDNIQKKVVCCFNLFDLEKHGFTQRIVNNMLAKYPKATKRSIEQSLEYFNYIINHTDHNNKIPLAVFRGAMKGKGYIDAPHGFKTNSEINKVANGHEDSLARESRLANESKDNKIKEERELKALNQWKRRVLEYNVELQDQILDSVQEQLLQHTESNVLDRYKIKHIKDVAFRSYFLSTVYNPGATDVN